MAASLLAPTWHILRGPIAVTSPFSEVGLGEPQQDHAPGGFEGSTRVIKIDRRTALVLAWFYARIEPAFPLPLFEIGRAARAACDRADMDVVVLDVSAVGAFGTAAAGEGGMPHDSGCRVNGSRWILGPLAADQ
jgi:hypothetical protein